MNVVISRRCDTRSAARLDFYAYKTYTDTDITLFNSAILKRDVSGGKQL